MKIDKCRSCGCKELKPIISLGEHYVSGFIDDDKNQGEKVPLALVLCEECKLLQMEYSAPPELMWNEQYWYKSALNSIIRNDLKDIANNTQRLVKLKDKDIVIDIGNNDGTMFEYYKNKNLTLVGFEPCKNVAEESKAKGFNIINNFFNAEEFYKRFNKKAKVITAISMFYDLEDPNKFLEDIKKCLDKDGLFIIQQNYLVSMLEQVAFCNICFKPNTFILGCNKPIENIKPSDKVLGMNGSLVNVKRVMERKYNGDMINIKPKYLESITSTPEHPIRIVRKETFKLNCTQLKNKFDNINPVWVNAKDVKKDDYVVIPRLKSKKEIKEIDLIKYNKFDNNNYRRGILSLPLNEETAWMIGLYIAQGHTNKMQVGNIIVCFTLNIKETEQAERLSKLFKKLGYKTNIKERIENHTLNIKVSCTALARALKDWIGNKAIVKKIPDFIMFAPKEIKIAFLRGLFDGDGYQKGNKIHFHTSSKILLLQTQLLIASLGGMVGASYVKPYPNRIIRGKEVISKDSWKLRGSSKILGEIFNYKYSGIDRKQFIMNKDYIFVPVTNISKEKYNGVVHNIETEDNTYLVSNAVTHNCHEHREFYSLKSLKKLLDKHGLEIFDVELNDINGGSIRTYIKFKENDSFKINRNKISEIITIENGLKLDTLEPYLKFAEGIEKSKTEVMNFLNKAKKEGKKVGLCGASTRGNTILQYFNITPDLVVGVSEANPDKYGKKTIGTLIPIMSIDEMKALKPDYQLVLIWHLFEGLKDKEKDFIKDGGKFVLPLPKFKIVGYKGT